MTPEAVVFDIGNVLITWDPEGFYEKRLGKARAKRFFAETGIEAMNLEIDRGAAFAPTVRAQAERHPDWSEEILLWHSHWLDLAPQPIAPSVQLMQRLQECGVPVFALSNFGVEPFEIACAAYPFLTRFNRSFISGALRQIKPEPEIYATLEAQSGIPPDKLLFTDDRPENVDAARARGWQAHLFDGAPGWEQVLVASGLLKESEIA